MEECREKRSLFSLQKLYSWVGQMHISVIFIQHFSALSQTWKTVVFPHIPICHKFVALYVCFIPFWGYCLFSVSCWVSLFYPPSASCYQNISKIPRWLRLLGSSCWNVVLKNEPAHRLMFLPILLPRRGRCHFSRMIIPCWPETHSLLPPLSQGRVH